MSPAVHPDLQLIEGVLDRNTRRVKAALEAGARVNGSIVRPLPFTPLVAATFADHAAMVNLLLDHGADPGRPVTESNLQHPCSSFNAIPGERALHIAARSGHVEIVRLLLKRSPADLNATDNAGYTPLNLTCCNPQACLEVVRLLLEAGADPTLAEQRGLLPLHLLAVHGHNPDLVDMLYSRAPATLNHCAYTAQTPLLSACCENNERMVSKLLSLGAAQVPPDGSGIFPLMLAAQKGFVGVVRALISERGTRAVGGHMVLANTLRTTIRFRQAIVLRLLLEVDGEERRSEWANTKVDGQHLLHYGAAICCPASVSVLLEAGAAEAARGSGGSIPLDVIGAGLGGRDGVQMRREDEVAIRRMLCRGPAYRARSWAWPSDEEADAGGGGDGDAAAAAAAAASVLSSPPAAVPKPPPGIGVRIFRPKDKNSSKFFVRVVCRYCAKD